MRASAKPWLTPVDRALLAALRTHPTVVAAARSIGISRDRAVYRLQRLKTAGVPPLIRATRGGPGRGGTVLTARGRRFAEQPEARGAGEPGPSGRTNRYRGTWHGTPSPTVSVGEGLAFAVSFLCAPGERVTVSVDPESVLLAPHRFPSSARNVLSARVRRVTRGRGETRWVEARMGDWPLRVAVTRSSVERLRLGPGRRVFAYVKATAVRRTPD